MDIVDQYQTRVSRFSRLEAALTARSEKLSNYRLATFGGGLAFGIIATMAADNRPIWMGILYLLSFGCFAWFIYLIIRHRVVSKEETRYRLLKELNREAIERVKRNWEGFPIPDAPEEYTKLPQSKDLDLFGPASLFQLISTQRTPQGRATLARWLVERTSPRIATQRQIAAKALKDHLNWRQNLAVIGETLAVDKAVIIPEWLNIDSWVRDHEKTRKYLVYAPWVTLAALVLTIFFPKFPLLIPVFIAHYFLVRKHQKQINHSLKGLAEEDRKIRSYSEVFEYIKECPASGEGLLKELIPKIREAREAMDQLNTIATSAASRGSMVHPVLIAWSAFDLRIVEKLESWQERYSKKFPAWFEALGEIEALASLSNLHHDEPQWAQAKFRESGKMEFKELGHPLIKKEVRVTNNIEVGPEGRFLLITGSNMAGKSTLLRSLGLNVILANVGAPVCALSMITPPLTIATSMSVQDSLVDGVSFFMAELQRIKEIVNLTIAEHEAGRTVLFLLDEILQGTNTVERREIVQRVVTNLVDNQAIGAITTHDLALAESETLTENADLIHFREHFERDSEGKPKMTFDYKIRPGVATTTNALKILEVIEMPV